MYSRIGTDENNMKIKMWIMLLTTIKKARSHCQDVDHCPYHLGRDHCHDGNRCQDGNEYADDQDQWSALKYTLCINLICSSMVLLD